MKTFVGSLVQILCMNVDVSLMINDFYCFDRNSRIVVNYFICTYYIGTRWHIRKFL